MKEVIEAIMSNPEKMAKYEASPVHKATLLAVYDFVKAGNKLEDLPWFASMKRATPVKLRKAA